MPVFTDGIAGTLWSTGTRKAITSTAAAIAAVAGAITGVNAAWPMVEPLLPAHRAYARDLSGHVEKIAESYANKNAIILRDVQVEQAEGKRDAVDGEIFKWTIELNKASDESVKPLISEQIRRLSVAKDKLNDQIKTLNAIKQKQ